MTQDLGLGDAPRLADALTAAASRAAAAILAVHDPTATRRDKPDSSPITAADEAADAVLREELMRLLPGVPIISEESKALPASLPDTALMVDPLDGTRELLAGHAEYAVNVALIQDAAPTIGIIAAPALATVWQGVVGRGAERLALAPGAAPAAARERMPIRTRRRPEQGVVALRSRFHHQVATEAALQGLARIEWQVVGSAMKFCRLAEGAADVYPRLSPMSDWDIAAGDALVTAAGGIMTKPDGAPLRYGQAGFRVPGFIAWGDRAAAKR